MPTYFFNCCWCVIVYLTIPMPTIFPQIKIIKQVFFFQKKVTKLCCLPGSLSPAMDCRLCAEVCEWPMELSAMLQRRLASPRLYMRSHCGGRSFIVLRHALGRLWYVSLRKAVISISSMQAISLKAIGASAP